jgi:hypothetical protein
MHTQAEHQEKRATQSFYGKTLALDHDDPKIDTTHLLAFAGHGEAR